MNKTITFFAKDLEKKIRLDKFLTNNLKLSLINVNNEIENV